MEHSDFWFVTATSTASLFLFLFNLDMFVERFLFINRLLKCIRLHKSQPYLHHTTHYPRTRFEIRDAYSKDHVNAKHTRENPKNSDFLL